MTFEEAVAVSPTLYAEYRLTTDNRTYQTNFYEMTRTYPPINLLLQKIRLERNKLFRDETLRRIIYDEESFCEVVQ